MPLLSEVGNRVAGSIGSVVDAHSKLRQRIDEILGSEPPRGPVHGNGSTNAPPASQAANLLQQCETLSDVIMELHNQIARLSAL